MDKLQAIIDYLRSLVATEQQPLPPAQQPNIAKAGTAAALDPAQAAAERERMSGL